VGANTDKFQVEFLLSGPGGRTIVSDAYAIVPRDFGEALTRRCLETKNLPGFAPSSDA
jgi:hypothetical protein